MLILLALVLAGGCRHLGIRHADSEQRVERWLSSLPAGYEHSQREAHWAREALQHFRGFTPPEDAEPARLGLEGGGFNVTFSRGDSVQRATAERMLHAIVRFADGDWIYLLKIDDHECELILAMANDRTVYWTRDHVCQGDHMHLWPPSGNHIPTSVTEFLACTARDHSQTTEWEQIGKLDRESSQQTPAGDVLKAAPEE